MEPNRIVFKQNPWPEGHPIKMFRWTARLVDGDVWFDLHLKSADYYSEREAEVEKAASSWSAPGVWGNFHACTLSSNHWHPGGFKVCSLSDYSPDRIDGLELNIDSDPDSVEDLDDLAFQIYLLGHDSVAHHKLAFKKEPGKETFSISWRGRIALTYVGENEFKHEFAALITEVPFPKLFETQL